ncbi:HVA22-like protein a [Camellia lanceoleosa]|uniref:HVA22-like protein a n=1 Tax=Camellia lanceoleosa TaxID=1840588 RepID=A0ACC0IPI6_9ERIC|nr:HVA22-like protein a [Camellia lanceoleosa]
MRNLVAYWIVFSLISLFELAFVKLIQWLPFWPYVKLMAICWLGIPNFKGACYVYECLIRSCLTVNLQGVIKRFVKHKDDLPLNAESFLAVAERYVKENGSEELVKLIDRSRHTTPNIDEEEMKAVMNTEEKETATAIQSKFEGPYVANKNAKAGELNEKNPAAATEQTFKEPNVAKEDAKAVEPKEKIPSDSTQWSKFKEPNVANKNTKVGKLNEKNPAAATEQVNSVEANLIQTEKKTVAVSEIIEKTDTRHKREQSRGCTCGGNWWWREQSHGDTCSGECSERVDRCCMSGDNHVREKPSVIFRGENTREILQQRKNKSR